MPQALPAEEYDEEIREVEPEKREMRRHHRREHRDSRRRREWREDSPKVQEALEILREEHPELHEEMMELRRENPQAFRKHLRGLVRMRKNPEARKQFLKAHETRLRVQELAKGYRHAEDKKDKAALKKELQKALSEAFDARLAQHEMRIKKMRREIKKMEGKISKRRGMKKKLVKKRLDRLTGEEEDWDW